jgi:hypothetical protein
MGILDWLVGAMADRAKADEPKADEPNTHGDVAPPPPGWACSSCGRADLPPAGGWDPPICLECDAAINFDADLDFFMHQDR